MASDSSPVTTRGPLQVAKRTELPPRAALALDQIQRICRAMFELGVEAGAPPSTFNGDNLDFGACLSLIGASGSWEVALFGDEVGCSGLARVIFAMEGEQLPLPDEIVDAMGELINMVSGAVKTKLDQTEHERLTIGVPIFHTSRADCQKYRTKVIPLVSQRLVSSQLEGELFLVWSERTPSVLLQEARACIEASDDKLSLGSGLAALHELYEIVADLTAPENLHAIELCRRQLTDIINETGNASRPYVVKVIDALVEAFSEDLLVPVQLPVWHPSVDAALDADADSPPVPVERDAEVIEMLSEFLGESQEGLEECDRQLLEIEQGRGTKDSVAALFRQFHTIKGIASFHELADIEHLAHSTENLLAAARDGKLPLAEAALDLVFESTALMQRLLRKVRAAIEACVSFPTSKAARALREKIEALLRGETVDTSGLGRALVADEQASAVEAAERPQVIETVKVELEQLNELDRVVVSIDTVIGALGHLRDRSDGSETAYIALCEVRQQAALLATRMRMVPLRTLFQKMTRMVRDLSKKTEKLAELTLVGEDTRVERQIADKLNGPLVHMLRNAMDHGLESADVRRNSGKSLIGAIQLSARQTPGHVIVEIADDGKGLDADAIWAKAKMRGIVTNEHRPPDAELFKMIFEPGFSTASVVTAISGRGVGMDVVRREIESIGGRIDIESEKGRGSVFRLTLPQSG